jgi:hypothetical protein
VLRATVLVDRAVLALGGVVVRQGIRGDVIVGVAAMRGSG